jgi:hypothetical protein
LLQGVQAVVLFVIVFADQDLNRDIEKSDWPSAAMYIYEHG